MEDAPVFVYSRWEIRIGWVFRVPGKWEGKETGKWNSAFTIQVKKTITRMGIKQVVTIMTAVASINRFSTFLNC